MTAHFRACITERRCARHSACSVRFYLSHRSSEATSCCYRLAVNVYHPVLIGVVTSSAKIEVSAVLCFSPKLITEFADCLHCDSCVFQCCCVCHFFSLSFCATLHIHMRTSVRCLRYYYSTFCHKVNTFQTTFLTKHHFLCFAQIFCAFSVHFYEQSVQKCAKCFAMSQLCAIMIKQCDTVTHSDYILHLREV